jgi:hypothetical protein
VPFCVIQTTTAPCATNYTSATVSWITSNFGGTVDSIDPPIDATSTTYE